MDREGQARVTDFGLTSFGFSAWRPGATLRLPPIDRSLCLTRSYPQVFHQSVYGRLVVDEIGNRPDATQERVDARRRMPQDGVRKIFENTKILGGAVVVPEQPIVTSRIAGLPEENRKALEDGVVELLRNIRALAAVASPVVAERVRQLVLVQL